MTSATCQGVWLMRLLNELQGREGGKFELRVDNRSAILLSKNPIYHSRTKHIDIKYHYVRDCVEEKKVNIEFVPSCDQLADALTKALGRTRLEDLRTRIGMAEVRMDRNQGGDCW